MKPQYSSNNIEFFKRIKAGKKKNQTIKKTKTKTEKESIV